MSDQYSLYEAKSNFSKIVRQVREGRGPVVVTVHGEPAVEIRAYTPMPTDIDARLAELVSRGIMTPATRNPRDVPWRPVAKRPGALKRFLDEREGE